jgi:SPP1 family predicted phage head-tail adaptor
MKIGDLKRRISLQSPSQFVDSLGQPQRSWSTYALVWSQISPMSGNEGLYGLQLKGLETHSVLIRWRSDIDVNHRFLYGDRIFHISNIRNLDENRQAMAIAATEWIGPEGVAQ